jgi:shikimate kinase
MSDPRHVVVAGLMGSGKTTLGSALATRLARPFVDSDQAIEASHGLNAREIEARDGLDRLHELEAEELLAALASAQPSVIAAAASTIEVPAARQAMSDPDVFVLWLRGSPEVLAARSAAGRHRPSGPLAELADQVTRRGPLFEQVADAVVDVDVLDREQALDTAQAMVLRPA